ncbi:histidine kinase [Puia dinghuensis]|uniref:Histidine kinase n=2 Tax=Puia dinghuensis TaxID=1792502 RepID=A0A8J2UCA0_9BACT|nr:histidine kinase [Puia dinghuensis]
MMVTSSEIRKQVLVALYSSVAISLLTTTPVFMMTRLSFGIYPWALVFTAVLALVMWGLNIGLFYFTAGGGRGSRWVRYVGSYVLCMVFSMGIFHGWQSPGINGGLTMRGRGFYFHLILFFSVDTVLLIIQDLVVTRWRKAAVELENARLRASNMEAMNQQLKQQIQPHFLFNSLSTLKSLIRHSPAAADEYLMKLSAFLRRAIDHPGEVVTVGEELALCVDYLEMQRMRFGEALRFSVEVPAGMQGFDVPVFALQLLIENAIKHNVLTKERPLSIRVVGEGRVITVINNLQLRDGGEGSGTGLANLRERYRVLGGGEVVVVTSATEFSVSITVLQHEDRDHRR